MPGPVIKELKNVVGLVFLVLAVMLAILAFLRNRRSYHDFADQHRPVAVENTSGGGTRVFGRAFVTAGWIVVALLNALLAFVTNRRAGDRFLYHVCRSDSTSILASPPTLAAYAVPRTSGRVISQPRPRVPDDHT